MRNKSQSNWSYSQSAADVFIRRKSSKDAGSTCALERASTEIISSNSKRKENKENKENSDEKQVELESLLEKDTIDICTIQEISRHAQSNVDYNNKNQSFHVAFWTKEKYSRVSTSTIHKSWMTRASAIFGRVLSEKIAQKLKMKQNIDDTELKCTEKDFKNIFQTEESINTYKHLQEKKKMATFSEDLDDGSRDNKIKKELSEMGWKAFKRFNSLKHPEYVTDNEIESTLLSYFETCVNTRLHFDSFEDILTSVKNVSTALCIVAMLFVFFIILEFTFVDSISVFGSILAIIIIWGNDGIRRLISGVILIFGVQPYQVGDAILLDGKRYNVKKMNLFTSWMTDSWNVMHVFNNTNILNARKTDGDLVNLTETGQAKFNLVFYIGYQTSSKKITTFFQDFEYQISTQLADKCGELMVVPGEFDCFGRQKIQIRVTSYVDFKNGKAKCETEMKLYSIMRDLLQEHNISPPMATVSMSGYENIKVQSPESQYYNHNRNKVNQTENVFNAE